ncbi:hypothetical protein [Bacillus phage YungSlug]|nr:hypothetical protein [Bacillus phage YungSlug]
MLINKGEVSGTRGKDGKIERVDSFRAVKCELCDTYHQVGEETYLNITGMVAIGNGGIIGSNPESWADHGVKSYYYCLSVNGESCLDKAIKGLVAKHPPKGGR